MGGAFLGGCNILAGDDGFAVAAIGPSRRPFAEDIDALADQFLIQLHADAVLNSEEVVVAEAFDVFGDIVGVAFDREGAGARGVFEDEAVFVAGLLEEVAGGLEVFVGFGGEADDHVAGELDVGDDSAGAFDEFEVGGGGVAAVHHFEEAVGAGLGGDVEVAADARGGGHDVEDVIAKIGGKAGDETEAREGGNFFVQSLQQFGEGGAFFRGAGRSGDVWGFGFVDVVVDGLSEEGDFEAAGVDEFFGFFEDGVGGAGDFSATGVGDDAVGAEFIAAANDADVGLKFLFVGGEAAGEVEEFEAVFFGVFHRFRAAGIVAGEGVLLFAGFEDVVEECGELVEFRGAAHEVDVGHAFHEGGSVAFGHAADDADDEGGVGGFAVFECAESGPDFLFGLFADGAGVVEGDVGIIEGGGEGVAKGTELVLDELGVEDVHLAAEGFEVDFFHRISEARIRCVSRVVEQLWPWCSR